MRPSTRLMAIAAMLAVVICGLACTKITGTDGRMETITVEYICIGEASEMAMLSYTASPDGSTIITDVSIPWSLTVELPADIRDIQLSGVKDDRDAFMAIAIKVDGVFVESNTADPGDDELWCRYSPE